MEKAAFPCRGFLWLALVTLGTLLAVPATRSLFYTQVRMETLTYSIDTDVAAESAAAARLPNDYPVQLVHAAQTPTTPLWDALDVFPSDAPAKDPFLETQARNRRIEALTQRFPDNPSVYANVLRYMALWEVNARRDEDGSDPDSNTTKRTHPVSPEALQRFEAAAQKGRQLDPDNAYFPMMQAVGLFVAHRDAEALNAFKAAGRCLHWNMYTQDSPDGLNRLQRAAYGDRGAIQRLFNDNEQAIPYAVLRSAARVAIHLARTQELAGKREEAVAVRHAVMRCGGLMRSQGVSAISALVGIAISNIATADPGGIPDPESLLSLQSKKETPQQQQERRNGYYSYLEHIGDPQEAEWAKKEIVAGDQALAIVREGFQYQGGYGRHFLDLSFCWLDNLALLVSALVLLILGASAHLASIFRPRRSLSVWRTAALFLIVIGVGFWQWQTLRYSAGPYLQVQHVVTYLIGDGADGQARATGVQCLAAEFTLLLPLLLVGLIAAFSLHQRVPLATGLGRGLRGIAIPAAAVLFLCYGLSLWLTATTEASLDSAIAKSARNQPHVLAESIHTAWPGNPQP